MPFIHKLPKKPRAKRSKRSNDSANFYSDRRWKKLRDYVMRESPLCVNCLKQGISTPATECHHDIPWNWFDEVQDKWKALLNIDILVPLCSKCHHEIHKTLKKPDNFKSTKYYNYIHNLPNIN